MNKSIEFSKKEAKWAAEFIAELVRQGITFDLAKDQISIRITITGGY